MITAFLVIFVIDDVAKRITVKVIGLDRVPLYVYLRWFYGSQLQVLRRNTRSCDRDTSKEVIYQIFIIKQNSF